jgi:hypothetical protein
VRYTFSPEALASRDPIVTHPFRNRYRIHLRSQEVAASRFSISLTKQRLILVSA